jgi:hypothetical protein
LVVLAVAVAVLIHRVIRPVRQARQVLPVMGVQVVDVVLNPRQLQLMLIKAVAAVAEVLLQFTVEMVVLV